MTQVGILQCRWVDNQLLDDVAQKEPMGSTAPPSNSAAGVCLTSLSMTWRGQWSTESPGVQVTPNRGNCGYTYPGAGLASKGTQPGGMGWWALQNSTKTNAKLCNPESKQYRLQWFRLATDWLAGKKQVCQKGHSGQQTEKEPLVCTGKGSQ